jgi:hypothetical protein
VTRTLMKMLLHNPDNGITGNFMPHLRMFVLQARMPPPHEVIYSPQKGSLAWFKVMIENQSVIFARVGGGRSASGL